MVRIYQKLISPLFPRSCRFYPTCSEYARISLERDSTPTALRKIVSRLGRCHPFHPGGVDYP